MLFSCDLFNITFELPSLLWMLRISKTNLQGNVIYVALSIIWWSSQFENTVISLQKSRIDPTLLRLLLLLDHQERADCSRQRVQTQADPESSPETHPGMSGPGHFSQGAGDGGGRNTMCPTSQTLLLCIISDSNLLCSPPPRTAPASNRHQKKTGGVCKEGESAQDQGTLINFKHYFAAQSHS